MLNTRIKKLAPYIANQIAAGEVIERPASVLKELLENSIDAKPSYIEVYVQAGGLQSIEVRDNGHGIYHEDLLLAITANATSKLNEIDDLYSLATLGFRGEALASIDAVAQLQISSKVQDVELAWTLQNGQLLPTAHPIGTTVKVSNLFYKVPVRKKFLRSAQLEFIYLEQIWKRIALGNFNIGFALYHNERLIKKLTACHNLQQQEQRLQELFGNIATKMLKINAQHHTLSLTGWVIIPEHALSTSEHQYLYLNQRFVKDKLLTHAIKEAYAEHLLPGKQALYCLYLTLPCAEFDVNVHPTKLEVRFHQPRVIHDFIMLSLREVLATSAPKPYAPDYKLPLAQANAESTDKLLTILANKIALMQEEHNLVLIDLVKLKNLLLTTALSSVPVNKYQLIQPLTLNFTINALWQQQLNALGLEIDQLNANTSVLRTIPQIFHELNLSCDYQNLLSFSKSTNLIEALSANSQLNLVTDVYLLIAKANALQIKPEAFKKIYNAAQLIKILT